MARQRRNTAGSGGGTGNNTTNSSTPNSIPKKPDKPNNKANNRNSKTKSSFIPSSAFILNKWKTSIGCICLGIALYFGYLGYLETRVNTPFDNQKMVQRSGLDDPDRYWGSYRPGTYFGLKTRDPHSLVMGLMWYSPQNLGHGGRGIRHWCEIGDNLDKYGWTHHDGKTFGRQEIQDLPFDIETSFVKIPGKQFGGDWTSRVSVKADNISSAMSKDISLVWYVALDERTNGHIKYISEEKSSAPGIYGESVGLGEFQVKFHAIKGKILHKSYLSAVSPSLKDLSETLFANFHIVNSKSGRKFISLPGPVTASSNGDKIDTNFIAIHLTVEADFILDISYQSTSGFALGEEIPSPPVGRDYTIALNEKMKNFDEKFEKTYKLAEKGYSKDEIDFAKYAVSNMVGGIGYFYGASKVQSVHTKNPVPYWKSPLYTAVPSRSFFPRGFLWDEGFHGLLIASWDLDIELDIICHWFDLLNVEGWIPREQILGVEALSKVPDEFVIQRNTNANPPTFFLTLKKILTKHRSELSAKGRFAVLERLYPRLQTWFAWFNTTQKGEKFGTYRWQGRDEKTIRELNPKTLTSGLDDYPRASHPNRRERHVDLRCWIAFAAGVMSELSTLLGKDDIKYYETFSYLTNNDLLNKLHLSPFTETYSDWGLHTDSVVLKRPQPTEENLRRHQKLELARVTLKQPDFRFVDSTLGYVSLFPFLLEILDTNSPYLGKILKEIRDPDKLWTNYGLRSLSKTSPLFMLSNTEHDPPYWRGPIWININYLTLKALNHYGNESGPHRDTAKMIYFELRENIVRNIFKEYKRTGYIWEQYDDRTGKGKGCNPFTGWSSLVVLIMSEQY